MSSAACPETQGACVREAQILETILCAVREVAEARGTLHRCAPPVRFATVSDVGQRGSGEGSPAEADADDGLHMTHFPGPRIVGSQSGCVVALAAASLWALCAMLVKNPALQGQVAANSAFIEHLCVALRTDEQEIQCAVAWTLGKLVAGTPSVQGVLGGAPGVLKGLLRVIAHSHVKCRGIAAMALRAIMFQHAANQALVLDAGGLAALGSLLGADDAPHLQAVAAWTLAVLAGLQATQGAICVYGGGQLLTKLVSLLGSGTSDVRKQVACAMYRIVFKNTDAQGRFGEVGGVERLADLVCREQANLTVVNAFLLALGSLCQMHSANMARLQGHATVVQAVCALLGCACSRVAEAATWTVLVLCAGTDTSTAAVQRRCVGYGALGHLLRQVCSPEEFGPERAVMALVRLVGCAPGHADILWAMGGHKALLAILVSPVCAKDVGKPAPTVSMAAGLPVVGQPTVRGQVAALMGLVTMVEVVQEPLVAQLKAVEPLIATLGRMAHPSFPDPMARTHAIRLLSKLSPAPLAVRL
jgi:hypothetical protein